MSDVQIRVVLFDEKRALTYIIVNGMIKGHIVGEEEFLVPSKYGSGNMVVTDYHVIYYSAGKERYHRWLSSIVLEGEENWMNTTTGQRTVQTMDLAFSLAGPLNAAFKGVKSLRWADRISALLTSRNIIVKFNDGQFKEAVFAFTGYIPFLATGVAAYNMVAYESKSIEVFEKIERNGFKKRKLITDLTDKIQTYTSDRQLNKIIVDSQKNQGGKSE